MESGCRHTGRSVIIVERSFVIWLGTSIVKSSSMATNNSGGTSEQLSTCVLTAPSQLGLWSVSDSESLWPWLLCAIVKVVIGAVWLDDLRHKHNILHDFPCFYSLQETDNWTTSAMNVPGFIVDGRDHDKTATPCPREVNHFRCSWFDHERCTAILVGSSMLFSIWKPHSCRDEEDHIEALEMVRNIMTEGRIAGAVIFCIEMKLGNTGDLQQLDRIGRYGPGWW